MFRQAGSQLRSCWFVAIIALMLAGPIAATYAAAAEEPPPDFKTMQRDFYKAYRAYDYAKALDILNKMHEAQPQDVDTLYNLACVSCLLGNKDKAYSWIDAAIKAGFQNADQLEQDDDFKTIHSEDHFRAIVKKLRAPRAAASSQPAPKPEPPKTTQPAKGEGKAKTETPKQPETTTKPAAPKKPEAPAKPEAPKKPETPKKPEAPKKAEEPKKPEKPAEPAKKETPAKKEMSAEELQNKVMDLTQKLIAASDAGDNEKALKLALEARELADIGLTNYNAACMYARLKKADEAFKYLERAVELGGLDEDLAGQIKADKDFDNIRNDARYPKVLEKAGGKKAAPAPAPAPTPKGEDKEAKPVPFQWKVTLPKNLDPAKKVPLIVALHAPDSNMDNAVKAWTEAATEVGAILLTPQGTYSAKEGSFRWGRDVDAIEESILDAIDQVMDKHKIDDSQVVVAGFGEGGWAAWQLLLRNPDAFCGIIPVACKFEAKSEADLKDSDLEKTRVYIMVGADDDADLVKSNRQAAERFEKIGAEVKLNVYDGVGHALPKEAAKEQVKALRFVLSKK
jgi:predicted esterase/tetratricopeptide (TPR) repeat protein